MNPLAVSSAPPCLMLGGAAVGAVLRRHLPQHHLNDHSKDIVRLGSGLVATMTALVLGLLITSAKNTYDIQRDEVRQIASRSWSCTTTSSRATDRKRITARELQRTGDGLDDRADLGRARHEVTDGQHHTSRAWRATWSFSAIEALAPQNEVQRNLKLRALQTTTSAITEARVLLFEEAEYGPAGAPPGRTDLLADHAVRRFHAVFPDQPDQRRGPGRSSPCRPPARSS